MSSVSAHNDQMRELRNTYDKREDNLRAEQEEKRKAQAEKYSESLKEVKDSFSEQLDEYRRDNLDKLSAREKAHQKEISSMKQLHIDQMRDAERSRRSETRRVEENKNDAIEWATKNHKNQIENLQEEYLRRNLESAETYENIIDRHKRSQAEGLMDQKDRLNDFHREEMGSSRKMQMDRVNKLSRDFANYRKHTNNNERRLEEKHRDDMRRISSVKSTEVNDLQERYADREAMIRDSFMNDREVMKENYARDVQNTRNTVYADIRERQVGTVSQMKTELLNQKRQNERDSIASQRSADKQVENVTHAYAEMAKDYQAREQQLVDDYRQENAKNFKALRNEYEDVFASKQMNDKRTSAFNKAKMREEFEYEKSRQEMVQAQRENRYKMQAENAKREQRKEIDQIKNMYKQQLADIQSANDAEKRDLRLALVQERELALRDLQGEYNKNDFDKDKQIAEIRSNYEQEIQKMSEEFETERMTAAQRHSQLLKYQNQTHSQNIEQMKQQYENKIGNIKMAYQGEIDEGRDRHDKQLDMAYQRMRS